MNLLPLILGGLALVVAAASRKPKAVATTGGTSTSGGGASTGGGSKPSTGGGGKPKPPAEDPNEICSYVMVRTAAADLEPTGSPTIDMGSKKRSDLQVVIGQAVTKANSVPDPFGGAPGTWTLFMNCPSSGPTQAAVVRSF